MADTYDITYDGTIVGTARMEKQGLYYLFSCRCRLPDQELYRIHVICGGNREDLGICVPMGDMFGMDKKIAAKRLGEGTPTFEMVLKDWKVQEIPEEPENEPEEPENEPEEPENEPEEPENEPEEPENESVKPKPILQEEKITEEEILSPVPVESFIPVREDEPFEQWDKLEHAVLDVQNDEVGILVYEE